MHGTDAGLKRYQIPVLDGCASAGPAAHRAADRHESRCLPATGLRRGAGGAGGGSRTDRPIKHAGSRCTQALVNSLRHWASR